MGNNVILSICIPTFNRLNHIKRHVAYFQREITAGYQDMVEVIISNNASSDGTQDFLDSCIHKHEWLIINSNTQNVGAHNNMLLLLSRARGEYIWIPGDDDYLKNGLIRTLLECLILNSPSYVYLSRRTINEQTKKIEMEGKTHCIEYDKLINVSHKQLYHLVKENFGDLKFQTSSIFLRENVIRYESEYQYYQAEVREDCHSLFRSIRSMQDGTSYFVSDVSILNGNEISWSHLIIDIISIYDSLFSLGLDRFGFSKKESISINNRQLAVAYAFYLTHKDIKVEWKKRGCPGWKYSLYPEVIYLLVRKIVRKLGLSKSHTIIPVRTHDFL